ncbi:MAG: UDP-N-acetylmuramoyl-tripeptide--D-alanyl-D-alanine ligase [Salinivirgaceae bacterium]|nr:UDP-N-acetylmuramoyl-tripeptide--D-alanyl-D-alanine ligase [Salinivirgaceae bacterium]
MNTPDLYEIYLVHPKICIDSRLVSKDAIFFALRGPNFNGNVYAEKALETCSYAVVDDESVVKSDKYILVENVLDKLQKLAKYHRKRLGIPVLAITGTNGKTTTKELVTRVLSKKYKTASTKGNFNNHIGVPLTLLEITKEHEFAVIEMGANHQGEISLLCKLAAPDFGLITNVGKAHLEGFGSFEGVKKAKSELYRYLYENDGTAFINYDNELLEDLNPPHSAIYYGTRGFTHCQGRIESNGVFLKFRWVSSDDDNISNEIEWKKDGKLITTKLIGEYNFENALAAVCIGKKFNISERRIKQAIESYTPQNNRSQFTETSKNRIIIDSYNANPTSMKASLENFTKLTATNKIVILGDMFELGAAAIREHGVVMALLEEYEIENAILIGSLFKNYSEVGNFNFFSNTEEAANYLEKIDLKDHLVLLKGSRAMKLEEIISYL